MSTEKQKPVQQIKIWPVTASVWKFEDRYAVTCNRSFKKDDGTYDSTVFLGRDDLLPAAKALDQAHSFILRTEAKEHEAKEKK